MASCLRRPGAQPGAAAWGAWRSQPRWRLQGAAPEAWDHSLGRAPGWLAAWPVRCPALPARHRRGPPWTRVRCPRWNRARALPHRRRHEACAARMAKTSALRGKSTVRETGRAGLNDNDTNSAAQTDGKVEVQIQRIPHALGWGAESCGLGPLPSSSFIFLSLLRGALLPTSNRLAPRSSIFYTAQ